MRSYKDKAAADAHVKTEHFQAFFKQITDEGLLGEEPVLMQTVSKGGFDLDRKLI